MALLVFLIVPGRGAEPRKAKGDIGPALQVSWAMTPTLSVDFTAAPQVTSPAASVARFSLWPLPIVAATVDVDRMHEVAVARIGSLHGP